MGWVGLDWIVWRSVVEPRVCTRETVMARRARSAGVPVLCLKVSRSGSFSVMVPVTVGIAETSGAEKVTA
jgi:hypothetical protein